MNKMYSTSEVAKVIGVNTRTLLRWLYAREIPEPKQKLGTGITAPRLWTEAELAFAKNYREQHYRRRS